jgi:formylglycine-generating enzyme required for sulfatase activity
MVSFQWCEIPSGEVEIEGRPYHVEAFHMGRYPVTYALFQQFIDAPDGFADDAWWDGLAASDHHRARPGHQRFEIDDHPREKVSWYDAVAYCRWLSARIGWYTVRLPTEWEWQWAAQGDDGRQYPWGNEFDRERCNTEENGVESTTPVDRYPAGASPFDVLDMSGNVWEWCLNEFAAPDNVDTGGDASRAARGGSWGHDQLFARVTYRNGSHPHDRSNYHGFRLVVDTFVRHPELVDT